MVFAGIRLKKDDSGFGASVDKLTDADLGEGDILMRSEWSGLNYKDALAITNRSPVVRKFPMIPGIDFAGHVEKSLNEKWQPGDRVFSTGLGYGETRLGGLSQFCKVSGGDLLRLPDELSAQQAMSIGTAGFTAMLAALRLEQHGVLPEDGDVLVTGASGGVGGFAITLLAKIGYRVVASTGRVQEADRLKSLGACEILDREELARPSRPLGKERWSAVIDSVGSQTLVNALAGVRYGGVAVACGLAQGMDLPGTVAPFILRGITLAGIDSVYFPVSERPAVWNRLITDVGSATIASLANSIKMTEAIALSPDLLAGKIKGRLVVDLS